MLVLILKNMTYRIIINPIMRTPLNQWLYEHGGRSEKDLIKDEDGKDCVLMSDRGGVIRVYPDL